MELIIGQNWIFTIPVTDSEGIAIPVADLEGLKVEIIQYGRVKGTFELKPGGPDDEIRETPDEDTFDYELTKSLSSTLIKGDVYMKIYKANTDALFLVDGEEADIDIIKLCEMV